VTSDFAPIHSALTSRNIPVEVVGLGAAESAEVADAGRVACPDDPTSNAALVRRGRAHGGGSPRTAMLGRQRAARHRPAAFAVGTHLSVSARLQRVEQRMPSSRRRSAGRPRRGCPWLPTLPPGHPVPLAEASDRLPRWPGEIRPPPASRRARSTFSTRWSSMIGLDVEPGQPSVPGRQAARVARRILRRGRPVP
jgi:hypothetical protein